MTIEDFKFGKQKVFVKVLSSTFNLNQHVKGLIGKILEVRIVDYDDDTVQVWDEDKNYYYFNFSDVQEMTPCYFKGERIGIGDTVVWDGEEPIVYDYHWEDGRWVLDMVEDMNYQNGCYSLSESRITSHTPLFPTVKKETLNLAGKIYYKEDIERALKDVKEVK